MNQNNGNKLDHSSNGAELKRSSSQETARHPGVSSSTVQEVSTRTVQNTRKFEQPVILQQSSIWSRAILWVLMGVTTAAVVWACVAKIEEAIPAQGKLEPLGAVKNIQAPVGGVVKAIYVTDGQRVQQGARLLSLDSTADVAELASLQKIRTALIQENQIYRAAIREPEALTVVDQERAQRLLPKEIFSLTKSLSTLAAENQIYRAGLGGLTSGRLNSEQLERVKSNHAELDTRVAAAQSEVEQLAKQLSQSQIQLAAAKDNLVLNQGILNDFQPLAKAGALSRLQYLQQRQEVRTGKSVVDQLIQEQERLKLEVSEAKSKLQNTLDLSRKDLLTLIADNDKNIAALESQLSLSMVENNNRIAEIDSKLRQTELNLKYQEIQAPVSGTVFDLQANAPGFVTNSTEPILKIVPDDALTAKIFITNRDIGFVKEGMTVDVRIDSFPFSEFGDVKGKLVWIGSDVLPPDQIRTMYTFPAKIRLDRQSILINGRTVPLQSGMSVSANMKVRNRTVMSIFTDLFTQKVEGLKSVR